MRRLTAWICIFWSSVLFAQQLELPVQPDSVRFAIIGDNGTGREPQYETAIQMTRYHKVFPFEFVLMLGDNIIGGKSPEDFRKKFETPYQELLDQKVKFYATLGNHDVPEESNYKPFNMSGKRYYTFEPKNGVRFFALDSTYMDKNQLQWLEGELGKSRAEWKICFFHHPLYSTGMAHGPSLSLRRVLEPLFIKYGVNLVFSGHEHFYERFTPQHNIYYFISGAGGELRRGSIITSEIVASGFDQDRHFMLFEVSPQKVYFQAVSRTGTIIDSGEIQHPEASADVR